MAWCLVKAQGQLVEHFALAMSIPVYLTFWLCLQLFHLFEFIYLMSQSG
jgi:hypothetical protein